MVRPITKQPANKAIGFILWIFKNRYYERKAGRREN